MEDAKLLAIVEVAHARRFACQAPGCGRPVFRQLHVVSHSGGFMVLGAGCYQKMVGDGASARPLHAAPHVRRLTERQCRLLAENPVRLMAEFDGGHASTFGALPALPGERGSVPRARIPPLPIRARRLFGAQAQKEVEAQYGHSSNLKGWRSLVDLRIRELAGRLIAPQP